MKAPLSQNFKLHAPSNQSSGVQQNMSGTINS